MNAGRLTKGERGALKSAVVGGQWPQTRLFKASLTDSPLCELCRHHGIEVNGSLVHRLHQCPYVEARASTDRPRTLTEKWEREGHDGCGKLRKGESAAEWERALIIGPALRRRKVCERFRWVVEPDGLCSNADVYIDGSMYDNLDSRCVVFGWAMAIAVGGVEVGSAHGNPPAYVRSIPATEAWALTMAIGYVDVGSSRFFTDCKSVRDVARSGMKRATAATQINARIWNITFARTDGRCPCIEWIPAHLLESQVGGWLASDGRAVGDEPTGGRFGEASGVGNPQAARRNCTGAEEHEGGGTGGGMGRASHVCGQQRGNGAKEGLGTVQGPAGRK